jgi:hypothetical protein
MSDGGSRPKRFTKRKASEIEQTTLADDEGDAMNGFIAGRTFTTILEAFSEEG